MVKLWAFIRLRKMVNLKVQALFSGMSGWVLMNWLAWWYEKLWAQKRVKNYYLKVWKMVNLKVRALFSGMPGWLLMTSPLAANTHTHHLYLTSPAGEEKVRGQCICPNSTMYLSKSENTFVHIWKCICPNCIFQTGSQHTHTHNLYL